MLAMMATAGPMQQQILESLAPGTYGGLVMRTRCIDDVVTAWARAGISQVVILGAGLDTRAYRLEELATVIVFEVDLPEIQRKKRRNLGDVRRCAREVRFVAVDFDTGRLELHWRRQIDRTVPALFVWEGVTQYLSETAVRSTLRFVGESPSGTGLIFTYVLPDQTRHGGYPGWSGPLKVQLRSAEPWLFGLDPERLASFLNDCGLQLLNDVGDAEYQERYLIPIGRHLLVDPGERVALAIV